MPVVSFTCGSLTAAQVTQVIRQAMYRLKDEARRSHSTDPALWNNIDSLFEVTVPEIPTPDGIGITHGAANIWLRDEYVFNAFMGRNFDGSERVKIVSRAEISGDRQNLEPTKYLVQTTKRVWVLFRDDYGRVEYRIRRPEPEDYEYAAPGSVFNAVTETFSYKGEEKTAYESKLIHDNYDDLETLHEYEGAEVQTEVVSTELIAPEDAEDLRQWETNPEFADAQFVHLGGKWEDETEATVTQKLPALYGNLSYTLQPSDVQLYNTRSNLRYERKLKKFLEGEKTTKAGEIRYRPVQPVPAKAGDVIHLEPVATEFIHDTLGDKKSMTYILMCSVPQYITANSIFAAYSKYSTDRTTINNRAVSGTPKYPLVAYQDYVTPPKDGRPGKKMRSIYLFFDPRLDDGKIAMVMHRNISIDKAVVWMQHPKEEPNRRHLHQTHGPAWDDGARPSESSSSRGRPAESSGGWNTVGSRSVRGRPGGK